MLKRLKTVRRRAATQMAEHGNGRRWAMAGHALKKNSLAQAGNDYCAVFDRGEPRGPKKRSPQSGGHHRGLLQSPVAVRGEATDLTG